MTNENLTNFYCSQKFTWLGVDVEKRLVYCCASADPVQIKLDWLHVNKGELFNLPLLQKDRQDMLNNTPVNSCNTSCWLPESLNLPSRRTTMATTQRTHTNIKADPTTLNINLGSTCNLTCSYCCKQYSSAWARDIQDNGLYLDMDRFKLSAIDQIVANVSQKEHQVSNGFKLITSEFKNFTNLEKIVISGGEPFLQNGLPDLLNQLTDNVGNITIFSGLGVDKNRLTTQLKKIKNKNQITIKVSAENIEQLYEFNRYGNSYTKFQENLELLLFHKFKVEFASTLSNLTVIGLLKFVKKFADYKIHYNFCNDPDFLGVSVLDDATKKTLIQELSLSGIEMKDQIINALTQSSSEQQRQNLSQYLKEFARRRSLALNIFPNSMLQWLNMQQQGQ